MKKQYKNPFEDPEAKLWDKKVKDYKIPKRKETPLEERAKPLTAPSVKEFVYVPKLRLYVAKQLTTIDDRVRAAASGIIDLSGKENGNNLTMNWHEAKHITKKLGSRMLTPAEFWVFYDFCLINNPNSIKDCIIHEWLDGLVINKRDLITNADVKGTSYTGGKVYKKVILLEEDDNKWIFNRENVEDKTGLPKKLDGGKWRYFGPKTDLTAMYCLLDLKCLYLDRQPDCSDYWPIGVREVREAAHLRKDNKK